MGGRCGWAERWCCWPGGGRDAVWARDEGHPDLRRLPAYDQPAEPVRWIYTAKMTVGPPADRPAIDITLHYTGRRPVRRRRLRPISYRQTGATLRVASSASDHAAEGHVHLSRQCRRLHLCADRDRSRRATEVPLFIAVDGSYFGVLLSPQSCLHASDLHLDLQRATHVRTSRTSTRSTVRLRLAHDLEHPNPGHARGRLAGVNVRVLLRADCADRNQERNQCADDVAKQAAEVGVVATTPTYALTGEPTRTAGKAPGAASGG